MVSTILKVVFFGDSYLFFDEFFEGWTEYCTSISFENASSIEVVESCLEYVSVL